MDLARWIHYMPSSLKFNTELKALGTRERYSPTDVLGKDFTFQVSFYCSGVLSTRNLPTLFSCPSSVGHYARLPVANLSRNGVLVIIQLVSGFAFFHMKVQTDCKPAEKKLFQ